MHARKTAESEQNDADLSIRVVEDASESETDPTETQLLCSADQEQTAEADRDERANSNSPSDSRMLNDRSETVVEDRMTYEVGMVALDLELASSARFAYLTPVDRPEPGTEFEQYLRDWRSLDEWLGFRHSKESTLRAMISVCSFMQTQSTSSKAYLLDPSTLEIRLNDEHDYEIRRSPSTIHAFRGLAARAPYSSPEEASRESLDERSLVYSLGCLIFHAFVGRPPFLCDDENKILNAHQFIGAPLVSPLKDLETTNTVVACALSKDPRNRFDSVIDLISDLEKLESGKDLGNSKAVHFIDRFIRKATFSTVALPVVCGIIAVFIYGFNFLTLLVVLAIWIALCMSANLVVACMSLVYNEPGPGQFLDRGFTFPQRSLIFSSVVLLLCGLAFCFFSAENKIPFIASMIVSICLMPYYRGLLSRIIDSHKNPVGSELAPLLVYFLSTASFWIVLILLFPALR